jgi:hypothetical protein
MNDKDTQLIWESYNTGPINEEWTATSVEDLFQGEDEDDDITLVDYIPGKGEKEISRGSKQEILNVIANYFGSELEGYKLTVTHEGLGETFEVTSAEGDLEKISEDPIPGHDDDAEVYDELDDFGDKKELHEQLDIHGRRLPGRSWTDLTHLQLGNAIEAIEIAIQQGHMVHGFSKDGETIEDLLMPLDAHLNTLDPDVHYIVVQLTPDPDNIKLFTVEPGPSLDDHIKRSVDSDADELHKLNTGQDL